MAKIMEDKRPMTVMTTSISTRVKAFWLFLGLESDVMFSDEVTHPFREQKNENQKKNGNNQKNVARNSQPVRDFYGENLPEFFKKVHGVLFMLHNVILSTL
jgi:hypothetical protein